MVTHEERAPESSQHHKKPIKQPDFTTMGWDASTTLQLISIIGSILGIITVWFQRKHIAAASRWVLGIPFPLLCHVGTYTESHIARTRPFRSTSSTSEKQQTIELPRITSWDDPHVEAGAAASAWAEEARIGVGKRYGCACKICKQVEVSV